MLAAYVGHGNHPRLSVGYFDRQIGNIVPAGSPHFKPQDGDALYHFNSLGYRSEEFDPHAQMKIFACGCSYSFGMGLPYEETWPIHLARLIATKNGLKEYDVSVQNFSQIGASNDYIARTIVQQCERARPDLAVVAFTHLNRAEYLAGSKITNLGYWNIMAPSSPETKPGKDYFRHYNDQYGLLATLKNMHWVQSAMQSRGIPFVFAWSDIDIFNEAGMWKDPDISLIRNLIDMSCFCRYSIRDPEIFVDTVDGHPGPRSQMNFAMKIFDTTQNRRAFSCVRQARASEKKGLSESGDFMAALKTRFFSLMERSGSPFDLVVAPWFPDVRRYFRDIRGQRGNSAQVISCVSDDSIVRRLIAACEVERPKFAFVWFSGAAVYEHVAEVGIVELAEYESINESVPEWKAYFAYLTGELRVASLLKNILLAQEYLSARKIPHRLIVPFLNRNELHPVGRLLVELLNEKIVVEGETRRPTVTKIGQLKAWSQHSSKYSNRDPNI